MPRPAIGSPFVTRLRDPQRQVLERAADARRESGKFTPSACTPAAVLRDLLEELTEHDADELVVRLAADPVTPDTRETDHTP